MVRDEPEARLLPLRRPGRTLSSCGTASGCSSCREVAPCSERSGERPGNYGGRPHGGHRSIRRSGPPRPSGPAKPAKRPRRGTRTTTLPRHQGSEQQAVHVPSLGVPSSASSIRRRNEGDDVTPAPSRRARSTSPRSDVTTLKASGERASASIRTISWSAASRPRREANATTAAPCVPGGTPGGWRSNTTVTSSPVAAAYRSSSPMSRRTARSRSFHQRSGREPMRFMPSISQRAPGRSRRVPRSWESASGAMALSWRSRTR